MDEDLRRLVKQWSAPAPSENFDERMLTAYRRRSAWWRQWWKARVEVPVPVLAASLLLVTFLGVWLATTRSEKKVLHSGWEPVARPALRVIRSGGTK